MRYLWCLKNKTLSSRVLKKFNWIKNWVFLYEQNIYFKKSSICHSHHYFISNYSDHMSKITISCRSLFIIVYAKYNELVDFYFTFFFRMFRIISSCHWSCKQVIVILNWTKPYRQTGVNNNIKNKILKFYFIRTLVWIVSTRNLLFFMFFIKHVISKTVFCQ